MKKLFCFLTVTAMLLSVMLWVASADDRYTLKDYIRHCFSETYQESVESSLEKIVLLDTSRENELWVLSGALSEYVVFDSPIEKTENAYIIQTAERYYITLQSATGNPVYLGITQNGEIFFGRYADYDKANYCEYLAADPAAVWAELSEICQPDQNGYINQKPAAKIPKCSDWAREAVAKAAEKSFIPSILMQYDFSENAERIDFCRMAYRMLNEKSQIEPHESTHPFTDVDKDERELAYLYEIGIIKGKSDTGFYPNDSISREEAATILNRLFRHIYPNELSDSDAEALYDDDSTVSDWAKSAVYAMKSHKIMVGVDHNSFAPKSPFSLEQTVITLVRIFEYK